MQIQALLIVVIVGVLTLIALWVISRGFSLWAQAKLSGADVPFGKILHMRFIRVDPRPVVFGRIRAVRAGLDIPVDDLVTHCLAGGSAARVVGAMARANEAGASLEWMTACAIDLAGRDPQTAADILIAAHNAGIELAPDELATIMTDDAAQEAFLARVQGAERPPG